ncbi:MAG TPA: hypothetical protein VG754_03555 [Verrucomicrobiae bacterium]|nr:hypothetical protein [Verrucomicrobiae bacterium]
MNHRPLFQKGLAGLLMLMLLIVQASALAQTNSAQSDQSVASNAPTVTNLVRAQQIRAACIQGRRYICGRVLEVTRNGLVVDSGYTSLLQPPFNHSWVVAGNVNATRPSNILEGTAPDSPCVGLVFLTDIPKRPAVHQYDYIVIHGFPAGSYNYKPLAGISKTVRRFSAGLETAVELNLNVKEH